MSGNAMLADTTGATTIKKRLARDEHFPLEKRTRVSVPSGR
jgi:hypothetical protein